MRGRSLRAAMLQPWDLSTVLKCGHFLENATLQSFEPDLPLEATQQDFVFALLQSVQTAPPEAGVSAVEWAGDMRLASEMARSI